MSSYGKGFIAPPTFLNFHFQERSHEYGNYRAAAGRESGEEVRRTRAFMMWA